MVSQLVKQHGRYLRRYLNVLLLTIEEEVNMNPENILLDLTMIGFWMGSILVLVIGNK